MQPARKAADKHHAGDGVSFKCSMEALCFGLVAGGFVAGFTVCSMLMAPSAAKLALAKSGGALCHSAPKSSGKAPAGFFQSLFSSTPRSAHLAMSGFGPHTTIDPEEYTSRIEELKEQMKRRVDPSILDWCLAIVEGRPGFPRNSHAQAGQDWLLFHNFFWGVPYGKGRYLDIGSNDPRHLSNTYFFDRCLGWKGVCVEPNDRYHAAYSTLERSCTLIKQCVAGWAQTRGMNFAAGVTGELLPEGEGKAVVCRSMSGLLEEFGLQSAELASIDIEGAEFETLRCFPFRKYGIQTWVVETNRGDARLEKLFLRGGYAAVAEVLAPSHRYSQGMRVGTLLDSVFRLISPPLILGPDFLPGRKLQNQGPRPACPAGSLECPEQTINFYEQEVNRTTMTLKDGTCGIPADGSPLNVGIPDSLHASAYDPAVALGK